MLLFELIFSCFLKNTNEFPEWVLISAPLKAFLMLVHGEWYQPLRRDWSNFHSVLYEQKHPLDIWPSPACTFSRRRQIRSPVLSLCTIPRGYISPVFGSQKEVTIICNIRKKLGEGPIFWKGKPYFCCPFKLSSVEIYGTYHECHSLQNRYYMYDMQQISKNIICI